jgi:hypothetical protein
MSSVFLQPFDRLPTTNGTRLDGFYFDRNAERVTLESASAPEGGTYAAGLFPAGWTAGRSPFRYERDFNATYTTLYQCFWFRHSENFTDNGTGLNKVFFYRGSGTNHYYAFESGRNGEQDGFYPRITLQGGAGNRDIRTTYHAKPLGVWRKYEILMVGNTPGQADGIARIWVNGQLILDARDVAYWSASQTPGWHGVAWDPTYGGGGNNVPYDMYQYIDQWYVSGR